MFTNREPINKMNIPPSTHSSKSRTALLMLETAIDALATSTGLSVFVKGQRATRDGALSEAPGAGVRAGGASAARLTFVLLCAPELLNAPYRVLSQAAGVSPGAIGPIVNDLAQRGFITHTKGNRRLLEKERLLSEWVTTYPLKLRPKLAPRRFHAADQHRWKAVDIDRVDAVWAAK